MAEIHRSALVAHAPEFMFDLVDDIDRYEEFLPWCKQSRIVGRSDECVRGELVVAAAGMRETLVTVNRGVRGESIDLELLEGPLKNFRGGWTFHAIGTVGCRVNLDVSFEFKSRLMGFAAASLLDSVADRLVDAFVARAEVLDERARASS